MKSLREEFGMKLAPLREGLRAFGKARLGAPQWADDGYLAYYDWWE